MLKLLVVSYLCTMTTPDQKLDLKLNEDNELSFRLSIEGTVSEPDIAQPNFRFTIMESGSGAKRGWIFPAIKGPDDIVTVKIPAPLKEGFRSNQSYHGKLEVIMGRLYFSPAEMILEFSAPISIKAESLNKVGSAIGAEKKFTATIITNKPQIVAPPVPVAKPLTPIIEEEVDLSDSELAEILSVIRERKAPTPNAPVIAPKPAIRPRAPKPELVPVATLKTIVEAPASPSEVATQSLRSAGTRAPIQTKPANKPVSVLRPKGPTLQEKEAFKNKFLNLFKEALKEVKK